MQDQQKSLTVRKGVDAYHLGDYIGHYCTPSTASIRKSFYCSLAGLALLLLSFVIAPYLVLETHAEIASVGATWNTVSLELDPDVAATTAGGSISDSGHGDVLFGDIHPTSVSGGNLGTEVVIKKTIGVTTPGKFYVVYLSTASDSNALSHTFASTNASIPAVSGSTPAVFSDSAWGYAMTSTVPTSKLGQELTHVNDSTIYNQDTWSAVPTLGNAAELYTNTTASSSGFSSGDTFDVYYGVMIDTDVLAGTYENELVYTALASSDALDEVSKNLTRSTYFVAEGTEQTLSFDLSTSVSTGDTNSLVAADDITVYLVPHSTILASKDLDGNYTVTSAMRTTAALPSDNGGYQTCSFSSADLSLTSSGSIIVCTMPAETPLGDNDGAGYYDFWIHIEPYDYNYISRYTDPSSTESGNTTGSVLYAGLQSTTADNDNDGANDPVVSQMQEMTPAICANTNIWNNVAGDGARLLDYTGTTQLVADIITTETDEDTGETTTVVDGAATAEASAALGLGTFQLVDSRDNKPYLVRRLADGYCWMVQNLELDLRTITKLTPEDSDVSEDWYASSLVDDYAVSRAVMASSTSTPQIYVRSFAYYDSDTIVYDATYNATNAPRYIGNFYNWMAFTAGTGSPTGAGNAPSSICPRGWHLSYASAAPSFRNLMNTYPIDGTTPLTDSSIVSAAIVAARAYPLQFTRNGYVGSNGYINGSLTYYASGYATQSANMRTFVIFTSSLNTASGYNKGYLMSTRCVCR